MQKVKICGITNIEDALYAANAGADALGFVFYSKSPRFVKPQIAKKIIKQLPPFVKTVGLFVNESADTINSYAKELGLDIAQIHFEVDEDFFCQIKVATLPVIRVQSRKDLFKFPNRYKIVDSYSKSYGGSGKRLNLEWFDGLDCSKIILAGGLNEQNVEQTLKYGFYGVDVSSGVEATYGKKDFKKVKQFINNAKK